MCDSLENVKQLSELTTISSSTPANSLAVDAIMFDFDGTLVNTIDIIVESYQQTYRHFGLREHSAEEIKLGIGRPLEAIFGEYPDLSEDLTRHYLDYNLKRTASNCGIYLGIWQMLQGLRDKKIPLAIVTAKRFENAKETIEFFELQPYFSTIVTKYDTTEHKPHPAPLLLGMQKLGLSDPHRIMYVGDAIYDIQAAHNGKFIAAAVNWTSIPLATLLAEQPHYLIKEPQALAQAVKPL